MLRRAGFVGAPSRLAFAVAVACLALPLAVAANAGQPQQADELYQRFYDVYTRNPNRPGARQEMIEAVGWLAEANRLSPGVYDFVFATGAAHTRLGDCAEAVGWYERAEALAPDVGARSAAESARGQCELKLAEARADLVVASGFFFKFNFKEGPGEIHERPLGELPSRLPTVSLDDSPQPLIDVLESAIPGLQVVDKGEFLVAGFEPPAALEGHYERGFQDFRRYLARQYFPNPSTRRIVALISESPFPLADATRQLYEQDGVDVSAPFLGYYNPADNLIMATSGSQGHGTLIHEMVHALIESDFPDAPDWLDEGLASLYERSLWASGGRLVPVANWRMYRIDEESLGSLQQTAAVIDRGGSGARGADTARTRLLLLFMDERDLVDDLYRMVKERGETFSLAGAIDELELVEEQWMSFVADTYRSFRAESQAASVDWQPISLAETRFVQRALNAVLDAELEVDGLWGESTEMKVTEFQQRFGLDPDGVVGSLTKAELERQLHLTQLRQPVSRRADLRRRQ